MTTRESSHVLGGLVLGLATLTSGCTKTVNLTETTPVSITAQAPAEPEPPPPEARVEVKDDHIEVKETVYFDLDKATIREDSHGLLDEVASVITTHPELVMIRIEGHTDSTGGSRYNMALSKRRAAAVRDHLIAKGVAADRLVAEGRGLDQPIADNETEDGRAKNRRVVFAIVERSNAMAAAPDATKAPDAAGGAQ